MGHPIESAAEEKQADAGPGEEGHDPAVVAGEDGGDEDERDFYISLGGESGRWRGCRVSGVGCGGEAIAEFDHEEGEPDHLAEEEGLGHGGGLEVEQVGIEGKEG